MSCEFGYTNCKNEDKRCDLCFNASNYVEIQTKKSTLKKKNNEKPTGRMGELFERKNHKSVKNNIESVTSANMTPNSGAGSIKGDENITGLIRIMEELKTQDPHRARGHNQFTIQRKWLDKLDREAEAKIKVADTRRQLAEAEATKFYAETEYLKALLEEAGIKYDDKSRGESTTNK